jgi:ribosomal protein S12 methylthiotransferase RimO
LGCARNEVDSEELAARFAAAGIEIVEEPGSADAVVVNTCGFVASAKKDSIDTLLSAADLKQGDTRAVIAVGCLAERYGEELASSLPEADAILGFDDYPDIAAKVQRVLAGDIPPAPQPQDRRLLLPLAPAGRAERVVSVPGHGDSEPAGVPACGPRQMRRRLEQSPVARLEIASGCDRRCTFCAIPTFRGAFLSRPPGDIIDEAKWLVDEGVSELFLVSENSTSFGKDLGNIRALEELLPQLAAVDGVERVRVSYLQPAEMRPSLIDVMSNTQHVARYFDVSFQHASGRVLRRMRRFGDVDSFLDLISSIRAVAPEAGIRSNIIVGFPGESYDDCLELERFLTNARLDVVGVFGYSDEDGTAAAELDGAHSASTISERVEYFSRLVEELTSQRAEDRMGEPVRVLVEEVTDAADGTRAFGRAEHQGPEVDGQVSLVTRGPTEPLAVGDWVEALVVDTDGVDLVAEYSR